MMAAVHSIPGVWFAPGTRELHVVDGDAEDGNSQCNPTESLPPNVVTHVRIEVRSQHVEVWLNDQLRCTADRSGSRRAFTGVTVYASDPYYEPAAASINHFYMMPMEPRPGCVDPMACNYDPHAVVDDGTCHVAADGDDCDGNSLQVEDGMTYFIRRPAPMPLDRNQEHAVVDLPSDYAIGFDITPRDTVVSGWASIIHLSATGNDCCEHGDR